MQFLTIHILHQLELVVAVHLAQVDCAHIQLEGAVKLVVLKVHSLEEVQLAVVVD